MALCNRGYGFTYFDHFNGAIVLHVFGPMRGPFFFQDGTVQNILTRFQPPVPWYESVLPLSMEEIGSVSHVFFVSCLFKILPWFILILNLRLDTTIWLVIISWNLNFCSVLFIFAQLIELETDRQEKLR